MPKALLLITQMETAGGQRAMMQHARELSRRGWEVCCATLYDKGNYISFFEKTYGLPILNFKASEKEVPLIETGFLL